MSNALIFDRQLVARHRERSANLLPGKDYLINEATQQLAERIKEDISRVPLSILEMGSRLGYLQTLLPPTPLYVSTDLSVRMARRNSGKRVVMDEEFVAFKPESFDLITSVLSLHWVNDLPGSLVQIKKCLKANGVFMASMLGGGTLSELRHAILEAETLLNTPSGPRTSIFTEVKDAGSLLQRAGFALPVADTQTITVMYKNIFELMKDLRAMGETNALFARQKTFMNRTLLAAINDHYHRLYSGAEGLIPATFEIITLTGWKN